MLGPKTVVLLDVGPSLYNCSALKELLSLQVDTTRNGEPSSVSLLLMSRGGCVIVLNSVKTPLTKQWTRSECLMPQPINVKTTGEV